MKKKFMKRLCLILTVFLFLSGCALGETGEWVCAFCGNTAAGDLCGSCGGKHVEFDELLALSREMAEMLISATNRDSLAWYVVGEEYNEIADELSAAFGGDNGIRETVLLYADCGKLEQILLSISETEEDTEPFITFMKTNMHMLPSYLVTMCNGKNGILWTAVSNILRAGKLQVLPGYANGLALLLLRYGEDAPCDIYVSMYAAEDGAALIQAGYVKMLRELVDEMKDELAAELENFDPEMYSGYEDDTAALAEAFASLAGSIVIRHYD